MDRDGDTIIARSVIINSDKRAGDGHIVRSTGLVADDFESNPVVQFGHGHTSAPIPVVGRGENLRLTATSERLAANAADIRFATATEFARDVAGLWAEGMLHATSIGWTDDGPDSVRVIGPDGQPVPEEDPALMWGMLPPGYGFEYLRWRLKEFSIVPVPSNPDAVRRIRSYPSVLEVCERSGMIARPEQIVVPDLPFEVRVGKVLSAANRGRVERAATAARECASALDELLAASASAEESQAAKPDPAEEDEDESMRSLAFAVAEAAVRLSEEHEDGTREEDHREADS